MKYKQRNMPTREALERISREHGLPHVVAEVESALSLINVANRYREEVYGKLEKDTGLSEGKFIMLMALMDNPDGLLMGELARRVGVADATASMMVKRMLAQYPSLVAVESTSGDKRERKVHLTESGKSLINRTLPYHHQQIIDFMKPLSDADKTQLVEILRKLL